MFGRPTACGRYNTEPISLAGTFAFNDQRSMMNDEWSKSSLKLAHAALHNCSQWKSRSI